MYHGLCTAHFISVELIYGTHSCTLKFIYTFSHTHTHIQTSKRCLDSFTIIFFGGFVAVVDSDQEFDYRYVAQALALAVIVIVIVTVNV